MSIALTAKRLYEAYTREQTPYKLDPLVAMIPGLAEVVEENNKMLKALTTTIQAAGEETSLTEETDEQQVSEGAEEGLAVEGTLPESEEGGEAVDAGDEGEVAEDGGAVEENNNEVSQELEQ